MTTEAVRLDRVEFASAVVTVRTEWTFARLHDAGGVSADVEITAGELTAEVVRLVAGAAASLKGAGIAGEEDVPSMLGVDAPRLRHDTALATAVSALRTGVSVIQALKGGVSLMEALGGPAAKQRAAVREHQPGPILDAADAGGLRGGSRPGRAGRIPGGEMCPVR